MNNATKTTMPRHIWMDAVIGEVKCSVEEVEQFVTRERVNRMYNAGEPVWMAADAVKQFVSIGRRASKLVDHASIPSLLRKDAIH